MDSCPRCVAGMAEQQHARHGAGRRALAAAAAARGGGGRRLPGGGGYYPAGQPPEWGPAASASQLGIDSAFLRGDGGGAAGVSEAEQMEGLRRSGGGDSSSSRSSGGEVMEGMHCDPPPPLPPLQHSAGRGGARGCVSGDDGVRAASAAAGARSARSRPGRPCSAPVMAALPPHPRGIDLAWLEKNGYFDMTILVRRDPSALELSNTLECGVWDLSHEHCSEGNRMPHPTTRKK